MYTHTPLVPSNNGSLSRDPPEITTAQTLDGINKQIAQNKKDLPAAIAANQAAGAVNGNEGASAISGASFSYITPSCFVGMSTNG